MSKATTLGLLMRDTLTGFEGHAVARIEHLHGVPELKLAVARDGVIRFEWIDEVRCVPASGEKTAGFESPPAPRITEKE